MTRFFDFHWSQDRVLRQLQSSEKMPGEDVLQRLQSSEKHASLDSLLDTNTLSLPAAMIRLDALTQVKEPWEHFLAENQRQINALDRWQDQWTSRFGPGTIFGDLCLAREGDEDAAWHLAGRLMNRWKPSPDADKELRARAREKESTRAREKRVALQRAVIHVTQYSTEEVSVRVEKKTIRNADGSPWMITPGDTHLTWYWWWVQHEVPGAANAELCGKPYPANRERLSDAFGVIEHLADGAECAENADTTHALIDALNEQLGAIGELQGILAQATDKERAFLDVLYVTDSIAEAERFSGMHEGAGRQMLFRLRNRVRRKA